MCVNVKRRSKGGIVQTTRPVSLSCRVLLCPNIEHTDYRKLFKVSQSLLSLEIFRKFK